MGLRDKILATALFSVVVTIVFSLNAGFANAAQEYSPCQTNQECADVVCLKNSGIFDYDSHGDTYSNYWCGVSGQPCTSFCGETTKKCLCGASQTGMCDQAPSFDYYVNVVSFGDDAGIGFPVGSYCVTPDGRPGEVYLTNCPSCGNGLTYCKPNAPQPEPSSAPQPTCGNGVRDAYGEECDGNDLSGCYSDAIGCDSQCQCVYEGGGYPPNEPPGPGGCYPPACPVPLPSYCWLDAFPTHVYAGDYSEIAGNYFNLWYEPYSACVDCGNGYGAYAWGCFGNTGVCYALCPYTASGFYTVTAYAGGTYCYPASVYVEDYQEPCPTCGPTATPTSVPTVYPPSCSVVMNPSTIVGAGQSTAIVSFTNIQDATTATVICGNGQTVTAQCGSGPNSQCIATCNYVAPGYYPFTYTVNAFVEGWSCNPGYVTLIEPIPSPPVPSPSPLPGTLEVLALSGCDGLPIAGATVSISGLGVFYSDANGLVIVPGVAPGTYYVYVSASGYLPASATGVVVSGQTTRVTVTLGCVRNPSCSIAINPSTIRGGSSTTVTVSYNDFDSTQIPAALQVACGNGVLISAACSGGSSGTCVGTCAYGLEQAYPVYYTLTTAIDGVQCSTATARIIAPIPTTGNLLVRVSDCDTGEPLQSARVSLNTPPPVCQATFCGDGTYNVFVNYTTIQSTNFFVVTVERVPDGVDNSTSITVRDSTGGLIIANYSMVVGDSYTIPNSLTVSFDAVVITQGQYGARLTVTSLSAPGPGWLVYYTDQYGEAFATNLNPGDWFAWVALQGYQSASATAPVYAGLTTTLPICLTRAQPDFTAQVINAPTCPYSTEPTPYQIKLTNNLGVQLTLLVTYSSPAITGPSVVTIPPYGSTIVDLFVNPTPGYAGGTIVLVTFTPQEPENPQSTLSLQLPVCLSGGLDLEAVVDFKTAFGGERVCYPLLVRNTGLARGIVDLVASFNSSENFVTEFVPQSFFITPQEIKNAEFCVTAPEGASTSPSFLLQAYSSINNDNDSVALQVYSQSSFHTDFSGCPTINATTTVVNQPITIWNDALSGDYEIEFTENDLLAVTDPVIYGFEKGTSRQVNIRMDAFGLNTGEHRFNLLLKKNGNVVFQQPLCFNIAGSNWVYAQLMPPSLLVPKIDGKTTLLKIKNLGTVRNVYSITADSNFTYVFITPNEVALNPGEETSVEVRIAPASSVANGEYVIPIKIFASTLSNASLYSVAFNCGNGQTKTVTCGYGTGSCQTTCSYSTAGSFLANALIDGQSCSVPVRVLDSIQNNSIVLSVFPDNNAQGFAASVNVNYYNLSVNTQPPQFVDNVTVNASNTTTYILWNTDEQSNATIKFGTTIDLSASASNSTFSTSHNQTLSSLTPNTQYYFTITACDSVSNCNTTNVMSFTTTALDTQQNNYSISVSSTTSSSSALSITVNCGNGLTAPATSCYGATGSCSAACYYSTAGTFTVTATASGVTTAPTVYDARVIASNPNDVSCALSATQNIVRGNDASITMKYYKIPAPSSSGSGSGLLETLNLLVSVVSGEASAFEPTVSPDFIIVAQPIEVVQGTTTRVPIIVKNDNYYSLPSVLVYVKNLPGGVSMDSITPFSLASKEEKTVYAYFNAKNAVPGNYQVEIHADSALVSAQQKSVSFTVKPAAEAPLNFGVSEPALAFANVGGKDAINASFSIQNNEATVTQYSVFVELPPGWTYQIAPSSGTLEASKNASFNALIFPTGFDSSKEYDASIVIRTPDNKVKRQAFKISASRFSPFSGLFIALSSDVGLIILLLAALAVGVVLAVFSSKNLKRAKEARSEASVPPVVTE